MGKENQSDVGNYERWLVHPSECDHEEVELSPELVDLMERIRILVLRRDSEWESASKELYEKQV